MKKIGILYICTGPYIAFWEDFFKTAEEFFFPDMEKHYFVFSDGEPELFDTPLRVHPIHIDNMPWPLITLMRYHFFMSVESQLRQMDYLMFSNANMKFVAPVMADEMLPREEKGEELFVVMHPGYCRMAPCQAPFERNKKSTAYVPYNYKEKYVIGAMNGGTVDGFLNMAQAIVATTNEDLKKNRIAKWHDESQINHYIACHGHYRMLTPEYCYPYGIDLPVEKKIIAVSKQAKFDVKTFKGMAPENRTFAQKVKGKVTKTATRIKNRLCAVRDMGKKVSGGL